jgi:hypothetical protein
MELFGASRDQLLTEYKREQLLFDDILNSTCSVDGLFSGVEFAEFDFTEYLQPSPSIPIIESNWGHNILDGWLDPTIKPKSNRGRKPKNKVKKTRKIQGEGSVMNSCIQFVVMGVNPTTGGVKKYMTKVFRNGRFQIPGVLKEDMSDVIEPLETLRKDLSFYFIDNVRLVNIYSNMRNYKFRLLEGKIDLRAFYQLCVDRFTKLKNISLDDLNKFLLMPIFNRGQFHPHDSESWNEMIEVYNSEQIPSVEYFKLEVDEFISSLIYSSNTNRGTLVSIDKLRAWITDYDPSRTYHRFLENMIALCNSYTRISSKTVTKILECMLIKTIVALRTLIIGNSDNQLSGFQLNTEKYSGLLLYIKTPTATNSQKRTTVKIFNSGKINIDGANNIHEADDIRWWINHILVENPHLRYANDYVHDGTDDEFSESEEEVIQQPNISALL